MAFCTVRFRSDSIQKQDCMNVIVPDGRGPFPVMYLLHGLSDDYSIWMRRTSIERYAEGKRLIVVMPDTHRFFYVNDPRPGGLAYEDHVIKDVVGTTDRLFPTIRSRRGRALAGLSMGGYGALMLAMRHPEMFCAASSHSGALCFPRMTRAGVPDAESLASALPKNKYDLFALARKLRRRSHKLAVRFDCGTDDHLIQYNRQFHAYLEGIGLDHQYAEYPGEHTWDYWDVHVQETLAFVMKNVARR